METTVIIGGKPIVIKASLGALALYKRQFNEDYLDLIAKPREDVDRADGATEITINGFRLIWAMAKAADESIDPPKEWVKQFDEFPLDVVVPAIYEMALNGFVSSKNLTRLMSRIQTIQPLHSTPSSSQESNED
jgi:hypothetical protein